MGLCAHRGPLYGSIIFRRRLGKSSMDAVVKAFIEAPDETFLDECMKDQLVKIADSCKVHVGDRRVKETIRANLTVNLFKMKVTGAGEVGPVAVGTEGSFPPLAGLDAGLTFEQ